MSKNACATNRVPLKWCKYELLEELELLPSGYLSTSIMRFSLGSPEILSWLTAELSKSAPTGSERLYVLKAVPLRLHRQLSNFRLECISDLPSAEAWLGTLPKEIIEVWACCTPIGTDVLSVAGRLATQCGDFTEQLLEQVWRCSPRLIERLTDGPFSHPYVRARRVGWRSRFHQEILYTPNSPQFNPDVIESEFRVSLAILNSVFSRIREFEHMCFSVGIKSFSIEYKIVDYDVLIIDWDTEDDLTVLKRFHHD